MNMLINKLSSKASKAAELRQLTVNEIEMISGGLQDDIVVTGRRYEQSYFDYNYLSYYSYYDSGSNFGEYSYGGGGGGGDPAPDPEPQDALSEDQEDAVKDGLEGLKSTLEEYVKKHGDFILKLPNGDTYKASQLIRGADALGKAFDGLEGAQLVSAVVNGNADVGAIVGFLGGLAGSAAVGAAGGGPLAVFVAGLAVSYGAEHGYNAIASTINTAVNNYFTNYNNQMQQANPGYNSLPSSIQEYIFLQQLFGNPAPDYDPEPSGIPYWKSQGYNNPHYNIP